jgi:hypothetical protein
MSVEKILDHDEVFVELLNRVYDKGGTPTLDRIDPHDSVIFSTIEVSRVLAELPAIAAVAGNDDERRALERVERLVIDGGMTLTGAIQ